MADKLPTPERLAEPTPDDIAQRLADDARSLAKRIDGYAGPLDEDLEHELGMLARAIEDVFADGR